ncbi:kinase-like protein [Punctularia strigosozonata HHB-11173 SS5]|uniref:kinase-like protein n=1 Tax=Punctularia strigosozonata (strain HHB-11173) TaxID=741275 RepID=UPI0004416274|nr:kinase-like protein [Punctularia strigosozonata HHB-11173 SS5]EIN11885.1 kinase-like protein [Punctularia strigosozonata HHB-11173 SS5]
MTNDDFDILPRWSQPSSHPHPDALSLSSSAAAQASAQSPYLYGGAAPPSAAAAAGVHNHRLPSIHQQQQHISSPASASSASPATRPPRISQLLDEDQPYAMNSLAGYASGPPPPNPQANSQLARSASFGGSSARGRRRVHDDLEGAFHADAPAGGAYAGESQQGSMQYYGGYSAGNGAGEGAYGGDTAATTHYATPKRSQTTRDPASARSPHRAIDTSSLDPYAPPNQGPYSPTTGTGGYQSAYADRPGHASPYSHSRSHSRAKGDALGPSYSPAGPPQTASAAAYGGYAAMDTSTSPQPQAPPPAAHAHLAAYAHSPQNSLSTPSSPLSHPHSFHPNAGQQQQQQQYYPQHDPQAMVVEPPPPSRRRADGFRQVRDARDLRPHVSAQPGGRRMGQNGTYLSPLRALTTDIIDTYRLCNPQFKYESSLNPRRVLTKPSKAAHNEGYDNEDYDYILYVNDCLGAEENRYLILDILGQGTFGQVVKCQNIKTHEIVAVKVVKNKPAYFNQSMMEVTILELLNNQCDPNDEHHILRLRDSFIHKNHLCLVFELLSSNLYELIKQNQFLGLSTQLVKVFTAQLLDALTVLKEARLIHCDLKPENILLKSLQSPQIKVIDFGSACHERQTVYTYIQSRFYRSPEVLLGIPYTAAIDMWSLGCIAVELFLGLPLFPGTSEYNQISRIVEMLGNPPDHMLAAGKQTNQFFDSYVDHYGQKKWKLKSLEQYSREHNTNEQPAKKYFKHTKLPDIINSAPMPAFKSSRAEHETEKELNSRASFIDFCQGLLNMDPIKRWSPQQARLHPFITGEKWTKPWTPMQAQAPDPQMPTPAPSAGPDPKRPYGGLVPSQPKGAQPYTDAASYNERLRQHQVHTAQAAQAQQAANNVVRNPYISPPSSTNASAGPQTGYGQGDYGASYGSQAQYTPASQQQPLGGGQRPLHHQSSHGQLQVNTSIPQHSSYATAGGLQPASNLRPNPPASSYYPNTRTRSNTINQIDNIPPALARLQHMNHDVISGRNALTPVMNRGDDAYREWERRQSGKAAAAQPYPELQYLHQQAELVAASGMTNWPQHQHHAGGRYPPPTSKLAHTYHAPPIVIDDDHNQRRDAVMSNVRSAARGDGQSMYGGASGSSAPIAAPPQAYNSGATTTGNRYASAYGQQPQAAASFDSIDRRNEIGSVYVPLQPDQYQSAYSAAGGAGPSQAGRGVAPPPQSVMPGFYGAGVPPGGQPAPAQQQGMMKDARRTSGMDIWPR